MDPRRRRLGIGLAATAVAAMEQGTVEAAVMLDPAVTLLQGKYKDCESSPIPAPRRTRSRCSAANIRAARSTPARTGSRRTEAAQALTNGDGRHPEVDSFAIRRKRSWPRCRTNWSAPTRRSISRR